MKTSSASNKLKKAAIKTGVVALWLLLWFLLSKIIGSEFLFPTPVAVITRLFELIKTEAFLKSCLFSVLRICTGCILGITAGSLLGFLTFFVKPAKEILTPLLTVIKSTPVASFIILLLVFFRRDEITVIVAGLLVTPILWANTQSGLASADTKLLEMSKIYNFSVLKKMRYIYLPVLKNSFSAGCSTAIGFSWKAGISAEVIASPVLAIGTAIYKAKIELEYVDLFAWTLTVIILSLLVEKGLTALIGRKNNGN